MKNDTLAVRPQLELAPQTSTPARMLTSLEILESAVRGGITSENVAVVKEIIAMRRDEIAAENKQKFNRAFFELKTEIAKMNFYADKVAKTDSGQPAYRYCSETELSAGLDPVLLRHGFTMLFGQRADAERSVAIVTLIHKDGHEETREFSVRSGNTNRMKDATAADTGATTSAWRHLVIKMFSLKSRINENEDARVEGDPNAFITPEQADEFERRAKLLDCAQSFLAFALPNSKAPKFAEIPAHRYEELDMLLSRKERQAK